MMSKAVSVRCWRKHHAASARVLLAALLGVVGLTGCGPAELPSTQLLVTVSAPDPAVAARLKLIVASVYAVGVTDERSPVEQRRFAVAGESPQPGEFTPPLSFGVIKGESDRVELVIKGYEDPNGESVIEQKAVASFQAQQQVPVFFVLTGACYRPPTPCAGLEQTCAPLDTPAHRAGACVPVDAASSVEPVWVPTGDDAGTSLPTLPADGGMTASAPADWCVDGGSDIACNTLRACEAGSGHSCTAIGLFYEHGLGVVKDTTRAVSYYELGCNYGHADACGLLAALIVEGDGAPKDDARALRLYMQACDGGGMQACEDLGTHYESGTLGLPRDLARARQLFTRSCDGDWESSCNRLGVIYELGRGVPVDTLRARSLYQRACDGDVAIACANLGWLMANGLGGAQDYIVARQLFTRACDGESPTGCSLLGWVYENGLGVAKDTARALELYRRACDEGNSRGCQGVQRLMP